MLGQRRETPWWTNDLVRLAEMLEWRQVTPGWVDDFVCEIQRGLEYQGRRGRIT